MDSMIPFYTEMGSVVRQTQGFLSGFKEAKAPEKKEE